MIDELIKKTGKVGRFESLVQMPVKRDPDWPKWSARASIPGKDTQTGIIGTGDTDIEAMEDLLRKLKTIQ